MSPLLCVHVQLCEHKLPNEVLKYKTCHRKNFPLCHVYMNKYLYALFCPSNIHSFKKKVINTLKVWIPRLVSIIKICSSPWWLSYFYFIITQYLIKWCLLKVSIDIMLNVNVTALTNQIVIHILDTMISSERSYAIKKITVHNMQ